MQLTLNSDNEFDKSKLELIFSNGSAGDGNVEVGHLQTQIDQLTKLVAALEDRVAAAETVAEEKPKTRRRRKTKAEVEAEAQAEQPSSDAEIEAATKQIEQELDTAILKDADPEPAQVPAAPAAPTEAIDLDEDDISLDEETVKLSGEMPERVAALITLAKQWLESAKLSASDLKPLSKKQFVAIAEKIGDNEVALKVLHDTFAKNFVLDTK